MATYRFPTASPSTSAVEMLLKGIALRQAMNREERGEAQDTREAALNALRLQQTQQGVDQNALVLEEARRAMGEEAAVREAMPALRAAPPTSIATMPGQAAVQAQFAPPEGAVEAGVPLPNMEPGMGVFQTAPAQPAVEPRSISAFTEAGLMEPAGGPAGYERLKRTRTGQAFLAERKPLSKPDVDKLVRIHKARNAYVAALEKAGQHMNTPDPTGMNQVRAYDAVIEGLRAVAEVDEHPENVTRTITDLMEKRGKLFNNEAARLLLAEDNRKILPAYATWVTKGDAESLAGYTIALLGAKSPEAILRGINFATHASNKQLEAFRANAETKEMAPFLDAVMAAVGASLTGGKPPDPNLWSEAGLRVFAKAQSDAAATDSAVSGPAKTILAAATKTLMQAIHGKGEGAENLGKLFFRDPKSELPIWDKAEQIVRQSGLKEGDKGFIEAVAKMAETIAQSSARPISTARTRLFETAEGGRQQAVRERRQAEQLAKDVRTEINTLDAVPSYARKSQPDWQAKRDDAAKRLTTHVGTIEKLSRRIRQFEQGVGGDAGRAPTRADIEAAWKQAGGDVAKAEAILRSQGLNPDLEVTD